MKRFKTFWEALSVFRSFDTVPEFLDDCLEHKIKGETGSPCNCLIARWFTDQIEDTITAVMSGLLRIEPKEYPNNLTDPLYKTCGLKKRFEIRAMGWFDRAGLADHDNLTAPGYRDKHKFLVA